MTDKVVPGEWQGPPRMKGKVRPANDTVRLA